MSTQTAMRDAGIFMFDPDSETMPREALNALQTTRLKRTLGRAYVEVPHYRKKFDAAGVTPNEFNALADIRRFPFTLKADLRDNYPFGMFAVPRAKLLRLHASSGTTGKPTVVGYTKGDLECWSDLMARSLACAGALPGDIVHNAYGYGLFTGGPRRALRGRAAWLHRRPGVRRRNRAPSDPAQGLRRQCAVRNAILRAQYCRGRRRHGGRSATVPIADWIVRGGAVERCHSARPRGPARDQGGGHLRLIGNLGSQRCVRMPGGASRTARMGRSLPVRDH